MDTVIYGLSNVLKNAPHAVSAQVMLVSTDADQLLHSVCNRSGFCNHANHGTAGSIIGVSRQTAVLAFQFGDGLSNIFWSDGRYRYHLWLGGISLQKWYKWFTPLFLILFVTQAILLGIATGIGF